jgi:hypothetical protein
MTHRPHRRQWLTAATLTVGLALAGLVTPAGADWYYSEFQDLMGRGTVTLAIVMSKNSVTLPGPNGGPRFADVMLRQHPTLGKNVMFIMYGAHFLCDSGEDSCHVTVRFDDGRPQIFWVGRPASQRTDWLFIEDYDRFVPQLGVCSGYVEKPVTRALLKIYAQEKQLLA